MVRNFRRLTVIERADTLLNCVDEIAASLPRDERYVLAEQMKRSALSIGSNIAEGAGRLTHADFERFLGIAAGSASELQYQLTVARRRDCAPHLVDAAEALADELKAMLYRLIEASRRGRA